jgi:hypothetical protein
MTKPGSAGLSFSGFPSSAGVPLSIHCLRLYFFATGAAVPPVFTTFPRL